MKKQRKLFTFFDIITILCVLLIGFLVFYFVYSSQSTKELTAKINFNGELYKSVNLSEITKPYELEIEGSGGVCVLLEKDGATILTSPCKDKVCVKTGKITKSGQSSVCLPQKVSVTLESNKNKYDSVTG